MMQYFVIQWKRMSRILPFVIVFAMLLGLGGYCLCDAAMDSLSQEKSKGTIALVGTESDPFLQMTVSLVSQMDSSRYALTLEAMTLVQAQQALRRGEVMAYVVFPAGFMDNALQGRLTPLEYVSDLGNEGIVALLREELTAALSDVILSAEYGAFAVGEVLADYGYTGSHNGKINEVAYVYAALLLQRENTCKFVISSDSQGIDTTLCGLFVAGVSLMCLPFAPCFIQENRSLYRMLLHKGCSAAGQVTAELFAFAGMISALSFFPLFSWLGIGKAFAVLPVIFTVCAIGIFIFSLSRDILLGTVFYLFISIILCFFGGTVYPTDFLPIPFQKAMAYLPTGVARSYFLNIIEEQSVGRETVILLLMSFLLWFGAVICRNVYLKAEGRRSK